MPGLIRGMARTAAVVGTAQATRNAVNRHSAEKDAKAYSDAMQAAQMPPPQQYAPPPQQYAPPPEAAPPPQPAPAAPAGSDLNSQLMQLAQLHSAGVLTDEEFAQAKAKLLTS